MEKVLTMVEWYSKFKLASSSSIKFCGHDLFLCGYSSRFLVAVSCKKKSVFFLFATNMHNADAFFDAKRLTDFL